MADAALARGITAAVAATLGKRFRAKLHLIGSSPLPVIDEKWATFSAEELKDLRKQIFREAVSRKEVPVKAWEKIEKAIEIARNLRTLQNEKIDFTYHSCDMTDADAVHRLMQKIIDEDRHITGIIHGAGFEAASRLEKKKNGNVRRTLDVKVKGAILLLKALKTLEVKPEYFIGFSSVSGRFGGVGQTDYCMANDMLAKLLDWNSVQNPSCRSVCFHWPAWGEIGMAVRPESKLALESAGLAFMPLSEGIAHLLNEIEFWGGEREILIVDWNYYKRFYPDDVSVPPIVGHEIVSKTCEETRSRRFILHGADADADALFKGLTARGADVGFNDNADDGETKRTETHIITTLRDPLGACIFGVNHWKARTATSLRNTLDLCKKLLTTNSENGNTRELVLLTATDFSNSTFFPEGFIIADILRTLFDAITQDALPIIRVLDFAADDSPKTVAEGTLRLLDSPCSPGAVTINRWDARKPVERRRPADGKAPDNAGGAGFVTMKKASGSWSSPGWRQFGKSSALMTDSKCSSMKRAGWVSGYMFAPIQRLIRRKWKMLIAISIGGPATRRRIGRRCCKKSGRTLRRFPASF